MGITHTPSARTPASPPSATGSGFRRARRHSRRPEQAAGHLGLVQYLWNQRDRKREEDYQCARVFRAAMDWLDDNAANAPFFLWIDSFDPHEPWDPPTEYADRYYRYGPEVEDPIDFIYPNNRDATPEEQERTKALYCGYVTFVDKWIGAFLDKLEAVLDKNSNLPGQLMFEVTESEPVRDPDHLSGIFDEYRNQGFTTAIDDFGAGHAGLSLLVDFNLSVL